MTDDHDHICASAANPLIHLRVSFSVWERIRWPRTYGQVWCRLHREARVKLYSGDLSVEVRVGDSCIISAHTGLITGRHARTGQPFAVRTAPLYLAAAERQGIPIETVPGYGYHA